MNGAAKNGHLAVVEWLHTNRTEGCTASAMDEAAQNQFWDVVDWLDQNRSEGGTAAIMAACASQGDIEGVYWCHYIGPPYDATAIEGAVLNGHFEIAWFLHQYRRSNINPA
ncbi:Ankyrin repeat-containing domain [Phytophthora cactorum]|nr:Ankyrin repeat-containing domain [Phytophthora cactorum]